MLVKLLTVIVVLLAAAWMLAGRGLAIPIRKGARAPARVPRAQDLVKCSRCGIWLASGQRCDCNEQA